MAPAVEFTEEAIADLARLSARKRATLLDEIEARLVHQPPVETRNRKPMRPNPIAPWELRVGPLRVCTMRSARIPPSSPCGASG